MISIIPGNPLCGKSTDEKPNYGMENGQQFYEMDTGKVYMYDAETKTWLEQGAKGVEA